MAYIIDDTCVDCKYTYCAAVCPVQAFHEGPNQLFIHPDTCIDCGACVPECPIEAIHSELDLPLSMEHCVATNAQASLFPVIETSKEPLRGPNCKDNRG